MGARSEFTDQIGHDLQYIISVPWRQLLYEIPRVPPEQTCVQDLHRIDPTRTNMYLKQIP